MLDKRISSGTTRNPLIIYFAVVVLFTGQGSIFLHFSPYRVYPVGVQCAIHYNNKYIHTRRMETGTGVGTETRAAVSSGDGNGDENEGGTGEGGRKAKKLKKPHNICRRDEGNEGDLGRKKKVLVHSCRPR